MKRAIKNVRDLISQFSLKKESELWKIVSEMTLPDLNRALYRCGQEERDEGHGFDTYNIPNFGSLVYAGFQGQFCQFCFHLVHRNTLCARFYVTFVQYSAQ